MRLPNTNRTHKEKPCVSSRIFRNKLAGEMMSEVLRVVLGVIVVERAVTKAQWNASGCQQSVAAPWSTFGARACAFARNYLNAGTKAGGTNSNGRSIRGVIVVHPNDLFAGAFRGHEE